MKAGVGAELSVCLLYLFGKMQEIADTLILLLKGALLHKYKPTDFLLKSVVVGTL